MTHPKMESKEKSLIPKDPLEALKHTDNVLKIIGILDDYTHRHVGTSATPCVFDFQFKEIALEILANLE